MTDPAKFERALAVFMDDTGRVWADIPGEGLVEYVRRSEAEHQALVDQISAIHARHGTNIPEHLPEPDRGLRASLYERLLRS